MLSACGVSAPIPATTFDGQRNPVCELRVGLNFKHTMSSGRDAFLGHAVVSQVGVEDHSTPEPETCASTNLGHFIQGAAE